jgi:hypothetical protein
VDAQASAPLFFTNRIARVKDQFLRITWMKATKGVR